MCDEMQAGQRHDPGDRDEQDAQEDPPPMSLSMAVSMAMSMATMNVDRRTQERKNASTQDRKQTLANGLQETFARTRVVRWGPLGKYIHTLVLPRLLGHRASGQATAGKRGMRWYGQTARCAQDSPFTPRRHPPVPTRREQCTRAAPCYLQPETLD